MSPTDTVNLGEQVLTGGTYSWSEGLTYNGTPLTPYLPSTSRIASAVPLPAPSNVYTLTYTNTSGVASTQTFYLNLGLTPITPWVQVNGGSWTENVSALTMNTGGTVCFAPWPNVISGWGWIGPAGFTASTREICPILTQGTNVYTATYTNPAGIPSNLTMTVTVAGYSVDLSWSAPVSQNDPVAGYHVYRATGSGAYALLGGLISATAYTDTTVIDGSSYNYEVKSVDAAGVESVASNVYAAVIP